MPQGLRAADAPIFQRHCDGDMTLLLRLGNLLQAQLTFTEPALAAVVGCKALVMDRRLRTADPAGFPALAQEHGAGDLGLVLVAADGWRTVALEDELDNPLMAAAAQPAEPGLAALVPTLSPALRGPVEGLLAARADDQRAAALEQLRYATPPLALVGELMPMLLADGAELVRERAIGLLVASGAAVAVVDLIRAIQRRDGAAIHRLAEQVARLTGSQLDLVVAALVAALARGQADQALVDLAAAIAPYLAGHRALSRVLDLLLPTGLSLLGLVRALQAQDRERTDQALMVSFGSSPAQDAVLVALLAGPAGAPVLERDRLLARGVELLLEPGPDPRERLPLAGALLRLDDGTLPARLAAASERIGRSWDTAVHWLLAELCRGGRIDHATTVALVPLLARILRDAPGPHLLAVLDQQLPALLPAGCGRHALVEPMVEAVARYRDDRTRDTVTACLMGLGDEAVAPLWRMLDDHPLPRVRMLVAALLPDLLPGRDPAQAVAAADAVTRMLAGLARIEQADERAARVTAAAALACTPALAADPAPAALVDTATAGLGDWAIEALGFLAAGPHVSAERRAAITDRLLGAVQEEVPDRNDPATADPAGGEPTWQIDDALSRHTDNVPRALAALGRIGTSPACPPELLTRLTGRLCRQWKLVSTWRVVWGPGCVQELGATLVRLAERPGFPGGLRVAVCEALVPGVSQLPVARGLARVLLHADSPYLATLAGRAVVRLVDLATGNHYAEDEQVELVETLTDFLAVPHLGGDGEAQRRRLVQLLALRKEHASSRARARLRYLAAELPEDLRARLDWA